MGFHQNKDQSGVAVVQVLAPTLTGHTSSATQLPMPCSRFGRAGQRQFGDVEKRDSTLHAAGVALNTTCRSGARAGRARRARISQRRGSFNE